MIQDGKLRLLQMQELELLLKFHRLCEENDLVYYLTGGTLLGAVRHKGFIPWDDDIDVAMPRRAYDRFAALCAHSLEKNYSYESYQITPDYPHYFSKLTFFAQKKNQKRAYIDIFPLDTCPDGDRAAYLFFKLFALVTNAISYKVTDDFACGYTRPYMIFLWELLRRFPLKSLYALRDSVRRLFGRMGSGQRICNVGGRYGFPGETYHKEWFFPRAQLIFEGHAFFVPSGWNELLTNMYGDYMTLPEESQRQGHVYDNRKRE